LPLIEHCILALSSPLGTESDSSELVLAPDAICKCAPLLRDRRPAYLLWDARTAVRGMDASHGVHASKGSLG
jgi:hypothetical protein